MATGLQSTVSGRRFLRGARTLVTQRLNHVLLAPFLEIGARAVTRKREVPMSGLEQRRAGRAVGELPFVAGPSGPRFVTRASASPTASASHVVGVRPPARAINMGLRCRRLNNGGDLGDRRVARISKLDADHRMRWRTQSCIGAATHKRLIVRPDNLLRRLDTILPAEANRSRNPAPANQPRSSASGNRCHSLQPRHLLALLAERGRAGPARVGRGVVGAIIERRQRYRGV